MLTEAISLTITLVRRPPLLVRRFWSVEVLPDPRKPPRSVMGIFGWLGVVIVSSEEDRRVDEVIVVVCVV